MKEQPVITRQSYKFSQLVMDHYLLFSILMIGLSFVLQALFEVRTKVLIFMLPMGLVSVLFLVAFFATPLKIKEDSSTILSFSFLLALCAIPMFHVTPLAQWSRTIQVGLLMGYFIFFTLFFALLGVFIKNLTLTEESVSNKKVFFILFLLSLFALVIMWMFYFPYIPSVDGRRQWDQIHHITPYSNIHTIGHTIFLKALLSIVGNYGIVIATHILLTSILFALFGVLLARRGLSYKIIALVTVCSICTFLPVQHLFYPQKDVMYTICLGGITLGMMHLLDRGNISILQAIGLGICLAFTTLFRHNGIVATVACLLFFLCILIKKKNMKAILAMNVAIILCFGGVHYYGYKVLGTQKEKNGYAFQSIGSGIAAVVAQNQNMSEEELGKINDILPVPWMQEQYTPWENNRLIWKGGLHNEFVTALANRPGEAIALYFRLLPDHFSLMLKDVIYNTYTLYGIYLYNFSQCHVFLFAVLLFAAIILAKRKHFPIKCFLVLLPIVCNIITIAISTITNEERYLMPTMTLFIFLFLYIITSQKPKGEDN